MLKDCMQFLVNGEVGTKRFEIPELKKILGLTEK